MGFGLSLSPLLQVDLDHTRGFNCMTPSVTLAEWGPKGGSIECLCLTL